MFSLDVLRPELAGFVAGEENDATGFFGVTVEHLLLHLRYSFATPLPVQISWHTQEHDDRTRQRLRRPRDDHIQRPSTANQNINYRQPGIAGAAVRTGDVRPLAPQHEYADDGHHVGKNHPEHDVGVELVVAPAQRQYP